MRKYTEVDRYRQSVKKSHKVTCKRKMHLYIRSILTEIDTLRKTKIKKKGNKMNGTLLHFDFE